MSNPNALNALGLIVFIFGGLLLGGCCGYPDAQTRVVCDGCGNCDFKSRMYAQQCPGNQGLTGLQRLHVKLSLAEKKQECSCCPPPPSFQSGDYSALVITRFVDKELVKTWLPKGLILDPECPFSDEHPVIIMCGEQRDFARTRERTQYPLWGRNFREVFISIPYLKLAKSPEKKPVHHFVRVYVDSWPATYMGIEMGWKKLFVPVDSRGNCYTIRNCNEQLLFKSHTDYSNAQPICEASNVSFAQVREMLEMPMVLHKPTGEGFKVVDFDFHFDCADVKSVSSKVCISDCFLPRFPPSQECIPGINETAYGAFHLKAHFTAKKMKY